MDGQHHKITSHSAGHEVHLCRRCGWPFPNPHPSAKNRRAHKRVCGKVEGYEIIHPDDRVTVSDDEHASDDEHHTPSPNIVKKNPESSSRVGDKLGKSEDDLFSDAVTEFSDSGISPQFDSVSELSKCLEKKSAEVEEATNRTKSSGARSEEITKSEPLANRNNQLDNVILITNTATELVAFGLTNDSQSELSDGGCVQGEMVHGQDADIHVQEHDSASVSLNPKQGKLAAAESRYELCDKLASDEAKHDALPPSESLQTVDASEGVNSVVHFEEISSSTKTVEACESTKSFSDASASGNIGATEELQSLESKMLNPVDANSALGSLDNAFPCEDDNTSMAKNDVDQCGETGNGKGEGASVSLNPKQGKLAAAESRYELCDKLASDEAKHDALPPSESLQTVDASEGVNSVVHFEEISSSTKTVEACESTKSFSDASASGNIGATEELQSLESKMLNPVDANSALGSLDNAFPCEDDNTSMAKNDVDQCGETGNGKGEGASVEVEVISDSTIASDIDAKGLRELSKLKSSSMESIDEVTGVLQSVGSVGDMPAVEASELANNIGIGFKSVEVEVANEMREDEIEALASGHSVSNKESTVCDSVLLSENVAKDDSCIQEGDKVSESIEVSVTGGMSESPSPKVEKTHSSNGLSTSKSFDTPSVEQTAPDVEDFHGNSDVTSMNAKSMLTDKPDNASELDSVISRSDSLEANCGSVVSDTIETNSQKHKTRSPNKSDTFEPPSLGAEIETLQKNEEPKSDALEAGWFPSLTNNVVNESEGRKKNEEMIAKVTNWSPSLVKQQHSPLKSLLSEEVKPPNTTNHKVEEDETSKHVEEWNSPARYPIQIKKEKKGRPFWVPFVCCSSVHRDL